MWEIIQQSWAQAVIWTTVGAILAVFGYYVVQKFRDSAAHDTPDASKLMSKFRELRSQGGLSEAEYRTIKSVLGEKLKEEGSDRNETT